MFWVIVWLLKSEQIWTELKDSFLHGSGVFRHWKGSCIYQCLSKKTKTKHNQKKKNPESYYYAILVVSQRLCLSTVPAFALYMCHPFHCAFLMKLSRASTMSKDSWKQICGKTVLWVSISAVRCDEPSSLLESPHWNLWH